MDNSEIKELKNNGGAGKNKIKCLIIGVIVLIILVVLACFLMKKGENGKDKDNKGDEIITVENKNSVNYINELDQKVKDYYFKRKLIDFDDLEYWDIDNVKYLGYDENDFDNLYYEVDGEYACKSGGSSCVYLEQIGDKKENGSYSYKVYVFMKDGSINNISGVFEDGKKGFVSQEMEIIKNETLNDDYIQSLKDWYSEKSFLVSKNLEYWIVNKVSYVKSVDGKQLYQFRGKYKCNDSSSSCVYLEQVDEKNSDGSYPFSVYAFVDNDKIISLQGVVVEDNKEEPKVESNDLVTERNDDEMADALISRVKKYYQTNNLVDENNLTYWNIDSVVYVGYESNKPDVRVYYLSGNFKCNDEGYSCVYLEQVDDLDGSVVDFGIYLFVTKDNIENASIGSGVTSGSFVKFNEKLR